jgi:hypothetical protein
MEEKEVIKQFQRMRIKWLIFSSINFIVLLALVDLMNSLQGNARIYAVFGMMISCIPWIAYTFTSYYCPKCGAPPLGSGGITINPDECLSCGARLRN